MTAQYLLLILTSTLVMYGKTPGMLEVILWCSHTE